MRRRDLIPCLVERQWSLRELAELMEVKPREAQEAMEHLLASLKHMPYRVEFVPARCRKCGFRFDSTKLTRPSKCPRCRSRWIAEPRIGLQPSPQRG